MNKIESVHAMKQQSSYNTWVLRLIYVLGLCAAINNIVSDEPELQKELQRSPSPDYYTLELEEDIKKVLSSASINDICEQPLEILSKLNKFGILSTDLKWNAKSGSIELDTLRRCHKKTDRAHRQMETICFKFDIDKELVDENSFLADPNHIVELNIIPQSFVQKTHLSCSGRFSHGLYDGSLAMISIYWNTKDQIHRRNLAFSTRVVKPFSH